MPATTTVLFDLDGTLLTYDQDVSEALSTAFDRTGTVPFCDADDVESAASDVGHAESDLDFLTRMFRIAADRSGVDAPAPALARNYWDAVDHTAISLRPGAEEALTLAEEYTVGMVTNGSRDTQRTKLDHLDIADAFETVVYAGDDTAPKPDPAPFDLALDRLGAHPTESIYVGNSLEHDVAGAQGAGLRAAWYPEPDADPTATGPHEPDHTLDTLAELRELL